MNIFDTPGCRNISRDYIRQYQYGIICHAYRRSIDRTHDRVKEADDEELAEPEDLGFGEMEDAEDVRIATDGVDK